MNNQKIENSFRNYLKECPEVETMLKDAILISNKLPKCKSLHVPKKIVEKLQLRDHQWIYLIINNLIHPVAYVKYNITIPIRLRKLVENDKNIEILINPFITNKVFFLSSFQPKIIKNNISFYYLYIHKIIKNKTKLIISIGNNHFYGSSFRNRIRVGKRIFDKLDFKPLKIYQFTVEISNNQFDNGHLFSKIINFNLKYSIKENKIVLPKLLPDFRIKDLGKQLEVFYETRCKDSKKIKINKEIEISEDLLRLFGMYQAEGTKTRTNYFDFTNNDPSQVIYFKETFNQIFGISNEHWSLEVRSDKNKEKIKNYWNNLLEISRINVILNKFNNNEYGNADLRIGNNTMREIVQRILKLIKKQ